MIIPELVEGPYATAELIELPVQANAVETVCQWLVTAPAYHPAWSQYILYVVRLTDDLPGFPPAIHHFEGTTHELSVLALDPTAGQFDVAGVQKHFDDGKLPHLMPVSVCIQMIANDEEMRQLAYLGVSAIANGIISPEAPMSLETHNGQWLTAMTKTLAHLRGEEHAP